jgi:hypothetical protein
MMAAAGTSTPTPIVSLPPPEKASAIAWLREAARTMKIGMFRTDGADWQAVEAVAAWLGAQP